MRTSKSLIIAAAIFLATGCDYMTPNATTPAQPGTNGDTTPVASDPTGSSNTATYQQVASQILQPKCYSCHSGQQNPNLTSWAAFAQDTRYVIPGMPSQSDVYVQVANGNMPQSGAKLTTAELKLLSDWITAGAPND